MVAADNDDGGQRDAQARAASIAKRGIAVKVLSFDGPKGYDVSDWVQDGGSFDALMKLVDEQETFTDSAAKVETSAVLLVEDLSTFMARMNGIPPLDWHVEGLIPDEGITLFHGQPRDFKSLCAQTIGLDLALGRAPLSNPRFAVKSAVPVAYFTNEDGERLFHARMRWLTMNTGPVSGFYPFIRSGITFDTPAGRDSIIATIKSCGARVVVFDPGRSFSALFDKGPADLSPVTDFLRRIQNETCAKSILIVHHDVKPPNVSNSNPERSRSQQASGGGNLQY